MSRPDHPTERDLDRLGGPPRAAGGRVTITEFLLARITGDEAAAKWVEDWGDSGSSALFHPARMLAECAAKRAIITTVQPSEDWDYDAAEHVCENVLRNLAAVYAGHPDYDPEWAL